MYIEQRLVIINVCPASNVWRISLHDIMICLISQTVDALWLIKQLIRQIKMVKSVIADRRHSHCALTDQSMHVTANNDPLCPSRD